ncbi:hypothetical protein DEA98_13550 [Brucella pseudogrignonensis]|uniref:Uncharacterized protein n=1 Tax=Brucella pseudogrignonensis TaxID=419475 RepID=A0A7Y3T415_9HYPH|nr:hypothetical protein [Brucella pseudogrignonensis]MCM0751929.1 hypothetical protein [Brucella pseudogrignonensis]NNV20676.1 hypothetical protein [Brucella pseudogrignonensis]
MNDRVLSLSEFEMKVVRTFACSSLDELQQGAALNTAMEVLITRGLVSKIGNLTPDGRRLSDELFGDAASDDPFNPFGSGPVPIGPRED